MPEPPPPSPFPEVILRICASNDRVECQTIDNKSLNHLPVHDERYRCFFLFIIEYNFFRSIQCAVVLLLLSRSYSYCVFVPENRCGSERSRRPSVFKTIINKSVFFFFLLSIFSIENNWTNGQFQLNHKDTQRSCIVCRMNVNWISSKNDRATAYPCRTKIRLAGCECEGRFWKSLDRRKNIQKQHWFGIFYRQWPSKTHAVCACVICIWTAEDVEIVLRYSVNPEQPRK